MKGNLTRSAPLSALKGTFCVTGQVHRDEEGKLFVVDTLHRVIYMDDLENAFVSLSCSLVSEPKVTEDRIKKSQHYMLYVPPAVQVTAQPKRPSVVQGSDAVVQGSAPVEKKDK